MTNAQPTVGARNSLRRAVSNSRTSLMLGTALGCSIAILAAAAPAYALNECGPQMGGDPDVVCTSTSGVGNPYPTGIDYNGNPGEDLTILVMDDVAVVAVGFDGVSADSATGFDVEVNLYEGATIESNLDGIFVRAFGLGGDATVNNEADVIAGQRGVLAFAQNGVATVNNSGDIIVNGSAPDLYSNAIVGVANYGGVVINNSGALTVDTSDNYGRGIYAFGYQADVSIINTGDISVTNDFGVAVGIYAGAYGIDTPVSVYSSGQIDLVSVGAANGIDVVSGFTADVDVFGDITAVSTLGAASGVSVAAQDAVSITVGADISTYADSALSNNYAITATTTAAPAGTIDIDVTGDVTAIGGNYVIGVYASGGGDIAIDVNGTIQVGDSADAAGETLTGWGVYAINTGGAGITINVDDVLVYQDGSYALGGGDGVLAYTVGTTLITADDIVTTGYYADGVNVGGRYGIGGDSFVTVDTVTTSGLGSDGIDVGATGDIDVTVTGEISTLGANADGLELDSSLGSILVDANSIVTLGDNAHGVDASALAGDIAIYAGDVYASGIGSDAIRAFTGVGGLYSNDIDIETGGNVYSVDGFGINADAAGFSAITVSGGSVYGFGAGISSTSISGTTIVNNGDVSGGAGLAINVDGGAANLTNGPNGTIFGAVDLTDNDDLFTNAGTFESYGTSSFGLGTDVLTNTGVIGVERYSGAAGTVTFTGLETLNNANGLVDMVDGQVGDRLVLAGTTFNGGTGSELGLDVQLGGPGSTADVLQITGLGQATAVTTIVPNDVLAGQDGVLNFGGILVVDSAFAGELGSEFTMANVDKGFVEYSLIFDAATDNWLIVGLPDTEAFQMLAVNAGSQDFWRRSGDAWTARMQEVRDSNGSASPTRSDGWEMWMQAHGGEESFDNFETFAISGFTFAEDLSTTSDWRGFQFGADTQSNGMIWGFTGGFTQQETRFGAGDNSFDFEGWNVGLYAGGNWGGLYLNALAKADYYTVDSNFSTIPAMGSFDGVTLGAQAELGYRFDAGSWFLEPHAQIAWTTTTLDDATDGVSVFRFDDAESLYGKAGARIGTTMGSGPVVLTPYVGVYAVEEFSGDNSLTFASGATSFQIDDQARGQYGQVELGVTAQTFYGLEASLKGDWNFGDDAEGGSVRLGARWRW